jgi:hypothetical protein
MFELVENHGISDDMNQIDQNHSATVKKSEGQIPWITLSASRASGNYVALDPELLR